MEGVSWSQRCHSKPGEPGRALPVGERLAGGRRERARTRTSARDTQRTETINKVIDHQLMIKRRMNNN